MSAGGDGAPEPVLLFIVVSGSDLSVHVYYGGKPGTEGETGDGERKGLSPRRGE